MVSLPRTMRAAVLHAPNDVQIEKVPLPEYEPDWVLVRVEACGICGTDIHITAGHMSPMWPPAYPFIQGHEWCGEVAAVGSRVEGFKIGDRVIVEPTIGCRRCARCLAGSYHLCENANRLDGGYRLLGHTHNGAFSEYGVAPPTNLHKIPPGMTWQQAVIVNQVVIALHALEIGRIAPADRVAITGPGLLGLSVMQLAKSLGASRTYITGRGYRLEVARELGVDVAIDITREDPVKVVMADTGGKGADLVVECSGAPEAIQQALGMVKRGGRLVLEGINGNQKVPLPTDRIVLDEISVLGARGSPNCYPRAIQLVADGKVNAHRLLTHDFPLERFKEAMDLFRERREGALRVAIKP